MLHEDRFQTRGRYRFASTGGVADPTLMHIAEEFENTVSRKFVSLTPGDLPRRFSGSEEVLCLTKVDGEGVLFYYEDGGPAFLFSPPSGRARLGFPALDEAIAKLKKANVRKGLFRVELHLPPMPDGRRSGVSEVVRVSANGSAEEIASFRLALLDAVMLDGRDLRPQQADFGATWELLGRLFGTDEKDLCHRVPGRLCREAELPEEFQKAIGAGGEGIVVRRLQRAEVIKTKPQRSVDAVVIGYVEGEFEGKYGVTSLLTALNYPREAAASGPLWLQAFARVGAGLTDDQRTALLGTLGPLKVDAPLSMTDPEGRPVHFVRPELLVELAGEDLVTIVGRAENKTQILAWEEGGYRFGGLGTFPRLTFARFTALRDDKSLAHGARVEQVLSQPVTPDRGAQLAPAAEARVLRREVYVKGTEMLRKLVVAETGAGEAGFPFVVTWTDYSSKRAEPLKVATGFARTPERAEALAAQFLAEGVTRGFVKYGEAAAQPAESVPGAEVPPAPAKPAKPRARKAKAEPTPSEESAA
ncbi:MAG: hypothetical protein JSR82_00720 [Verrucomicrobia bacterium]|nr:hypothetical protein [Verrucomicrobiota bacterium]